MVLIRYFDTKSMFVNFQLFQNSFFFVYFLTNQKAVFKKEVSSKIQNLFFGKMFLADMDFIPKFEDLTSTMIYTEKVQNFQKRNCDSVRPM